VGANHYTISASAEFLSENTKDSLAILKERFLEPNISPETVEEAKKRLKDEYSSVEPSPYVKFSKVMYKNSPNQYSAKDKLESLDSITEKDVKDLYNEIFANAEGQVIVTGPFSKHPELKQEIFNSVADLKEVKPKEVQVQSRYIPNEKIEVLTEVDNKNQANIIEGFKFKVNGNVKDNIAIELLANILGGSTSSRLFSDLREKRHLAYMVHASSDISPNEDEGLMLLRIKTTTENKETGEKTFDNLRKSIDGFNENIEKLKNEKISEEELNNAKKAMKSEMLSFTETSFGKFCELCESMSSLYGKNYKNEQFKMIDEITVDDIQNAANYVFSTKPVYSMTATQETLDANKEYLDSLAK
jgi:predicted Zn-dependent peptidase